MSSGFPSTKSEKHMCERVIREREENCQFKKITLFLTLNLEMNH